MIQSLMEFLPKDAGQAGTASALIGLLVGAVLWVMGARWSRRIVPLMTTAIGAAIGSQMPEWFGWKISGMGPGIGLAVILGVSGFVLHRFWVGIGLGLLLATWTAVGTWIAFRNGATWQWPALAKEMSAGGWLVELWKSLPEDVRKILPYSSGAAMVSGVAASIIKDRAVTVLNWALAGTTLLTFMGLLIVQIKQPDWIGKLPRQNWAQIALLVAVVCASAGIQWRLSAQRGEDDHKNASGKSQES